MRECRSHSLLKGNSSGKRTGLKFPEEILWLSAYAGSNIRTEVPIPPDKKILSPAFTFIFASVA